MATVQPIKPDQGWSWVVLVAAFFCNLTFDGIIFSFGIFYLEFLDFFQEGRGPTSWIGSVISGVYAIVGPIASVLANKYGCRAVTIAGAIIASTGFILSTFSKNIWVMMLTYGIMGGFGFGLMYLCAYVMIGYFFEKYRALATGFTSCGSGVGTFIFAPLSQALIDNYGWKGGMLLIAGFVLNGIVMGAVFRPFPKPEPVEGEKQKLIDWKLLTNPVFMVFASSSFLCLLGFFVPFIYLPDFARKIDLSKQQGAFLLSIIGITNTLGRILCGWLSDKAWCDSLKLYTSALIIGGVATMAASWLTSYWMLCCYAAVFGWCVAAYVSLCAIILIEFLGLEKLSNSFGFLNMFRGIATFIGAPLAGFLFDVTGQYDLAFYVAGAFIAMSGIICLPLRIFRRCDGGATADAIHQYEKELAMKVEDAKNGESKMAAASTILGEAANGDQLHYSKGSNLNLYTRGIMGGEMGKAAFSSSLENLRKDMDSGSFHGSLPGSLHGSTMSVSRLAAESGRNRSATVGAEAGAGKRCEKCKNSKCQCSGAMEKLLQQKVANV